MIQLKHNLNIQQSLKNHTLQLRIKNQSILRKNKFQLSNVQLQVEHTKSEQSKHISNSDKNTTENISDQQSHESHEQSSNDTKIKSLTF